MSKRILIANRATVADRVIRAAHALGHETVAVHSEADAALPYVHHATLAAALPGNQAMETYLNQDRILEIALEHQCDAVHPGYGFLAENAAFADKVRAAGLVFIGPSTEHIRQLGNKIEARNLFSSLGVPVFGSSSRIHSLEELARAANDIGYPVMLKPADGGGGIGMFPIYDVAMLEKCWEQSVLISQRAFGSSSVYLEKLAQAPKHIEFQYLSDQYGHVEFIGSRDCSVQRRRQKVIEEGPVLRPAQAEVAEMAERLRAVLQHIGYQVIGTVETLWDPQLGFSFLEVNTRLQVEHAVTEETSGVDIVQTQINLAFGQSLDQARRAHGTASGHAVQARIYAEDPVKFYPSCGTIATFDFPTHDGIRLELGYGQGNVVSPFYDPMMGKVIASAESREAAVHLLKSYLSRCTIQGVKTNIPFVLKTLEDDEFINNTYTTNRN